MNSVVKVLLIAAIVIIIFFAVGFFLIGSVEISETQTCFGTICI